MYPKKQIEELFEMCKVNCCLFKIERTRRHKLCNTTGQKLKSTYIKVKKKNSKLPFIEKKKKLNLQ